MLIRKSIAAIGVAACLTFLLPAVANADSRGDRHQSDQSSNWDNGRDSKSSDQSDNSRNSRHQDQTSDPKDQQQGSKDQSRHHDKTDNSDPTTSTTNGPQPLTCNNADIPAGTYSWVTVTGKCQVPSGVVNVKGRLLVKSGAVLNAASAGTLNVNGGVKVGRNAILNLGSSASSDRIRGGVRANGASAVILHFDTISGGVQISRGGGGVNCTVNTDLSAPLYTDVEDSTIRGDVSITGVKSCWMGFIRNHVHGTVKIKNNSFADPDANEVVTNVISGNLKCSGNDPVAQAGDSGGQPNQVDGRATGECKSL